MTFDLIFFTSINLLLFIMVIAPYLALNILAPFELVGGNQVVRLVLFLLTTLILLFYPLGFNWLNIGIASFSIIVLYLEAITLIPVRRTISKNVEEPGIRILTFNSAEKEPDEWMDYFFNNNIDIACIQEVKLDYSNSIHEKLKSRGGHSLFVNNNKCDYGIAFISKTALKLESVLEVQGDRSYPLISANVSDTEITLIGVHLSSVIPNWEIIDFIGNYTTRIAQSKAILGKMKESLNPVIICGDFNATATERILRIIRNHFKDTWLQAGRGIGGTWHRLLPIFRIDYIYTRGFDRPFQVGFVSIGKSDHRAYQVSLSRSANGK
ncbi:endonuclease/exonuclease/phosphatase family protein [Calditrichota bacterium]